MISVNFHQWHSLFNYILFSLSPLTKEELKRYKSLECYNHFTSGWVKEVRIQVFLNYLLKLLCLLDESVCDVFPSSFYCLILFRCILFIASAKIQERKGSICHPAFIGNCPTISHKCWPILLSRWVPFFVPAVPSPQTYIAVSGVAQFTVCGVFVDN